MLYKSGGCSVGELASALGLDVSTMSRIADGLVRRGLLLRTEDAWDRRRVCFQLTEDGARLVKDRDGPVRQPDP